MRSERRIDSWPNKLWLSSRTDGIYWWAVENRHRRIRNFLRPGGPLHRLDCRLYLLRNRPRAFGGKRWQDRLPTHGVVQTSVFSPVPLAVKYGRN